MLQLMSPKDKGYSWMVLLGGLSMNILVPGAVWKMFGLIFIPMQNRYGATAAQISSIPSLVIGIGLLFATPANMLTNHFNARTVAFCSGVLCMVGYVSSMFVSSLSLLYLSYGLCLGIASGLVYSPGIIIVGEYFDKKKALANGIAFSGSGVGSMVFPVLVRFFLDKYGLDGTLMMMGGITLNICVVAMLFRPHLFYAERYQHRLRMRRLRTLAGCDNSNFESDDQPKSLYEMEMEIEVVIDEKTGKDIGQKEGVDGISRNTVTNRKHIVSNGRENVKETSKDESSNGKEHITDIELQEHHVTDKPSSPGTVVKETTPTKISTKTPVTPTFQWYLITYPTIIIYMASSGLSVVCYTGLVIMTPAHAEHYGHSPGVASSLISVMGVADFISRIFIAIIVHRGMASTRHMYTTSLFVNSLALASVAWMAHYGLGYWPLAITCGISASCAGCFMSLTPLILADIAGVERLRASYALVLLSMGLCNIAAPYGYGALRDYTGAWDTSYYVAASGSLAVGLLCALAIPAAKTYADGMDKKRKYNGVG